MADFTTLDSAFIEPCCPEEISSLIDEQKTLVDEFCSQYGVKLTDIALSCENEHPEPAYSFSDNLGYYTISGIKESLHLN